MVWSKSNKKGNGQPFTDQDIQLRAPLPRFQRVKALEMSAMAVAKLNPKVRVHCVCTGFLYGNGEQNDIFYEFFRRAWVSLHPELAALPVVGEGNNIIPTIHVNDLTRCIDYLLTDGPVDQPYLIAVDQCEDSCQKQIMQSISSTIGSGEVKNMKISEVYSQPWCELLTVDVKLQVSQCLKEACRWEFKDGINPESMKKLNEQFNYFRGLFPLKVFITGPPCSGKTYLSQKLSKEYGIPHITIKDIIKMGMALKDEFGQRLQQKIEELKDQAEADYEKTKKKKDPEFDRENYHPRLTDDILFDLAKIQVNSAGCMNKGFILDGYPRSFNDAKEIFMTKTFKPAEGEEAEP